MYLLAEGHDSLAQVLVDVLLRPENGLSTCIELRKRMYAQTKILTFHGSNMCHRPRMSYRAGAI